MARVRRDNVAQQTPRWASKEAITAIYRRARDLGQTVDHVVPLKGRNVSGLHVENNLQILPRSENSSKGNHFIL
jgi:5-methylcytosine-specific restriction endonuclease McrA